MIRLLTLFWPSLGLFSILMAQPEQIYETMEVERYLIQVNVTDNQGKPVRGLDRSDFEIRIGRQPQIVETLEYFKLDAPDAARSLSLSQHGRRLFVLFFDMRYNSERGILAARRAAIQFVNNELLPLDLTAVVIGTARTGVLPIVNFTSDRNQLLKALNDLGLAQARGREYGPAGYFTGGLIGEYLGVLDASQFLDGNLIASSAYNLSRVGNPDNLGTENPNPNILRTMRLVIDEARKQERMDYASNVVNFTESLESFARGLSFIRGRKNLILFSNGYDSSQLTGVTSRELMANAEASLTGETFGIDSTQLGNAIVQSRMDNLIETMQGSGTVIFAIDSSGLDQPSSRKSGIQSLNTLALDTGGKLFENENRFINPMREIKTITNEYYVLSVVPDGRFKSGEVEKLRVDVNRPGMRVYAQRGLAIRPDFKSLNPLERQLHIADYIAKDVLSYDVPATLHVVPVQEAGDLIRLTVQVDVDGNYFPEGDRGEQPMEFYVMAVDRQRNVVIDSMASQYSLRLDSVGKELTGNGLRYVTSLIVPPGTHRVKAVVRDLTNGRVGSMIETLVVKKALPDISVRVLDTLARPTLEGKRDKLVDGIDLGYPFKLEDRFFSPRPDNRLTTDREAMFFYLVDKPKIGKMSEPDVKAIIQKPDGQLAVVPPEHLKLDYRRDNATNSLTPLLLFIDMARLDLPKGNYQLLTQIQLRGQDSMRVVTPFTL